MNDCSCLTHPGPHWLHLDHMERARNLMLLQHAVEALEARNGVQATFIYQSYTHAELERLTAKMKNIAVHDLKEVEEDKELDEQEKVLYGKMKESREKTMRCYVGK